MLNLEPLASSFYDATLAQLGTDLKTVYNVGKRLRFLAEQEHLSLRQVEQQFASALRRICEGKGGDLSEFQEWVEYERPDGSKGKIAVACDLVQSILGRETSGRQQAYAKQLFDYSYVPTDAVSDFVAATSDPKNKALMYTTGVVFGFAIFGGMRTPGSVSALEQKTFVAAPLTVIPAFLVPRFVEESGMNAGEASLYMLAPFPLGMALGFLGAKIHPWSAPALATFGIAISATTLVATTLVDMLTGDQAVDANL